MPTEEDQPRGPIWDDIRKAWILIDYVAGNPLAGDETKKAADSWVKAFAAVDSYENRTILILRERRKRWPWRLP